MTTVLNLRHGAYHQNANNVYNFDQLEYAVGRKFDIYSTFISFDSTVAGHAEHLTASRAGHEILIAWAPTRTVGLRFADILTGAFDAKIDEWLNYFATFPTTVTIRFGWEMNGSFMRYSPLYSQTAMDSSHCLSAAQYQDVWRYLVNRQRAKGATNIRWYFCSNGGDAPNRADNTLESFYPGSAYVDIIGYDSYNSLNGLYMTPAQTFRGKTNNVQRDNYDRCVALHPTAPVWVGETGCVDLNDPKDVSPTLAPGHSKPAWVSETFALDVAPTMPRLAAINWFNYKGTRNWRFDSSSAALTAFKTEFSKAGAPIPSAIRPVAWTGHDNEGNNVAGTFSVEARTGA